MLTNDAKKLLYVLYTEFTARRKVGISRNRAKFFRSAKSIQENFAPDSCIEDVFDYLCELHRNGFVLNRYADNTVYECYLTDEAIVMLENLPKDTLLSVADFISKFIP